MRKQLQQHELRLLDDCVTCNHVHLLVEGEDRAELSAWMQSVAREQVLREPCWRESLVMGSAEFVGRMQPLILSRQETEMVEARSPSSLRREKELGKRA